MSQSILPSSIRSESRNVALQLFLAAHSGETLSRNVRMVPVMRASRISLLA